MHITAFLTSMSPTRESSNLRVLLETPNREDLIGHERVTDKTQQDWFVKTVSNRAKTYYKKCYF